MSDPFTRLVLGVLLAVLVCWILIVGQFIILPFIAGIIGAYVIHGLAERIADLPGLGRLPRALPYMLSVTLIGAMFAFMFWLVTINLGRVMTLAPTYQDRLLALAQTAATHFGLQTEPTWISLRSTVMAEVDTRRLIGSTAGPVLSLAVTLLAVLVYTGFLLLERADFDRKISLLSDDPDQVARLRRVIQDINARIGTYLVMKTLINVALAVLSYLIMRAFGIEFAGFWAVLIGLFNYIPYVGSYLGVGFPALVAIAQFAAVWPVTLFILIMSGAQILLGTFIEPWLMGRSLNLSRAVILLSLVAWASIWGIPGAILSVPIMAMLVIILSEFRSTRPIAILLSQDGDLGSAVQQPKA